jgi:hypothetical protein
MTDRRDYVDYIDDEQGHRFYVNDRVRVTVPGVRSDNAWIIAILSPGLVRVELQTGGLMNARVADLDLLRRRTDDEVPL